MKKHILTDDYVLFSDFDGTITLQDSTVALVNLYGSELNQRDEELFIGGKITNREAIQRHYRTMLLSPEKYYGVMYSMELDPGFKQFYQAVKASGFELSVLTGSAAEGVRNYLVKNGFEDIVVYGNELRVENGAVILYPEDEIHETLCQKGPCAHCKSKHLAKAKREGKKVIYIGDGITDLCAATHADLLFAKGVLAQRCAKSGMAFERFESFDDLYRYFFMDK